MRPYEGFGRSDQVRVEPPAQTAIRGNQHEVNIMLFTVGQQGVRQGLTLREVLQHLFQLLGVRAGGERGLLRPAQPGGRDHLHRLGNLLDVADRRDASADRFQGSHEGVYAVKLSLNSLRAASMRPLRSSVNSLFVRMSS